MIKRVLNTLFILVIATIVTMSGVLPHHHHSDNSICFTTSLDNHHDSDTHDTCPLDQKLVVSSNTAVHHHKCSACLGSDHDSDHHTWFVWTIETINYTAILDTREWIYKPFNRISLISERVLYSPLRAPPVA